MTPFMKDFIKVIDGVPGATERDQIKYCITNAKPIVVSDDAVKILSDVISEAPHTIEQNMDFLSVPFKHIWLEWDEKSRLDDSYVLREDRLYPQKIGALIVNYNEAQGVFVAIVAWQFENGNV